MKIMYITYTCNSLAWSFQWGPCNPLQYTAKTAYMDNMDLAVHCLRKSVEFSLWVNSVLLMYDPKCSTTFPWCTINAPVAFAWCTMYAPAVFAWCTNHFVHEVEFLYMGWNGVHPLWFYHSPPGPEQFLVCGLLCRLQEYHMITGVQKKK